MSHHCKTNTLFMSAARGHQPLEWGLDLTLHIKSYGEFCLLLVSYQPS